MGTQEREPRDAGASGHPPQLSPAEERKADEEQSLDARTTFEVIRRAGERELERSDAALAWSALAAGLAMGFSLAAQGLLHAHLPDAPWRPLVVALGYAAGFLIVILGSQQLFTENTLTAIVPLLSRRDVATLRNVARLGALVLLANLPARSPSPWWPRARSCSTRRCATPHGDLARSDVGRLRDHGAARSSPDGSSPCWCGCSPPRRRRTSG